MYSKFKFLIMGLISLNFFSEVSFSQANVNYSFISALRDCFENENFLICEKLILQSENMQLNEYNAGNLRCQTSLLAVQTELIRNLYFKNKKKYLAGKTIPALIKNC